MNHVLWVLVKATECLASSGGGPSGTGLGDRERGHFAGARLLGNVDCQIIEMKARLRFLWTKPNGHEQVGLRKHDVIYVALDGCYHGGSKG
jgi:hypothetical protein